MGLVLCSLCLAVVRTIAGLNALQSAHETNQTPFAVTGRVLATTARGNFTLEDASGRTFIYNSMPVGQRIIPIAGDRISANGVVIFESDGFVCFCASKISRLGHEDPGQPFEVSVEDIVEGRCDYRLVRLTGRVTDAFDDEIDTSYSHLVIGADAKSVLVPIPSTPRVRNLLDAEIAVTGICRPRYRGQRIFHQHSVDILGTNSIRVLKPAPADRFTAPPLGDLRDLRPSEISSLGSRTAVGTVVAVWDGNRLMIEPDGFSVRRILAVLRDGNPPPLNTHVKIVGLPETDLFTITLTRADWRPEPEIGADGGKSSNRNRELPETVTAATLLANDRGQREIRAAYQGRTVRVSGILRSVTAAGDPSPRLYVESGGHVIPVNVSACPNALQSIASGCEIEVTGVCLLMAERWRSGMRFPHVEGFTLIVRTEKDLRILRRPAWWTPIRLAAALLVLGIALVGILVWNRILNRIVERRSRELIRERSARESANLKLDERTRLAVELHDTLAQDLTGLALQFDAAEMVGAEDPSAALPYLKAASLKLKNCRANLRDCIWDLRSRAFDEKNLSDAICRTVTPHIDAAALSVDCDIPCHDFSDNAIHQILSIIRELAINAVRHGHATRLSVSGRMLEGHLELAVADNGQGFDPAARPGPETGHFGLQGVAERVHRLEGSFELTSSPGHGARIVLHHLCPTI